MSQIAVSPKLAEPTEKKEPEKKEPEKKEPEKKEPEKKEPEKKEPEKKTLEEKALEEKAVAEELSRHGTIQELFGISITFLEGKDLVAADISGKSDPYVEFVIADWKGRTRKQKQTLNPVWEETFCHVFDSPPDQVKLTVWDWDRLTKSDFLGDITIPLNGLFGVKEEAKTEHAGFPVVEIKNSKNQDVKVRTVSGWFQLQNKEKRGKIKIQITPAFIPQLVGRSTDNPDLLKPTDPRYVELFELAILRAKGLKSRDTLSLSDPYVMVNFGQHGFKTKVKFNTLNPEWNQFCPIWCTEENLSHVVKIVVYDWDSKNEAKQKNVLTHSKTSDLLGAAFLRPKSFTVGKEYNVCIPLMGDDPTTDAALSSLLQRLQDMSFDPEKTETSDIKSEFGYLEIKVRRRLKETVADEFYKNAIDTYDLNKDGHLELTEIIHMCTTLGSTLSNEEIEECFNAQDKGGKKYLTKMELGALLEDTKFNQQNIRRTLYLAMQYGAEGMDNLLTGGLFADELQHAYVTIDAPEWSNDGTELLIQDRQTGLMVHENIPSYIKSAMRLGYRTGVGRGFVESKKIRKTLKAMTIKQGEKMDNPRSTSKIDSFILLHHLNVDEIEKPIKTFKTFNEFFYRTLKPGCRPLASPDDRSIAVAPADARYSAFATFDDAKKLWIKGDAFTIHNLLGDWGKGGKADAWNGGSLVVSRLAPQDYHRWHWPVFGFPGLRFPIDGGYDTVNPIAIRRNVNVYTENKRVVCPVETKEFGTVLMIAVGATAVGSIRFECECKSLPKGESNCADGKCKSGKEIKKGDPHGYFAFGGSTVLLIFKAGKISLDGDILENSKKRIETLIKVGERIGVSTEGLTRS